MSDVCATDAQVIQVAIGEARQFADAYLIVVPLSDFSRE